MMMHPASYILANVVDAFTVAKYSIFVKLIIYKIPYTE